MNESKIPSLVKLGAFASLSLGLAPFFPEPHIWGKIKWVAGGAEGMTSTDYFDLAMHGAPWVILIIGLIQWAMQKKG